MNDARTLVFRGGEGAEERKMSEESEESEDLGWVPLKWRGILRSLIF